jgi:peroxiredoxin
MTNRKVWGSRLNFIWLIAIFQSLIFADFAGAEDAPTTTPQSLQKASPALISTQKLPVTAPAISWPVWSKTKSPMLWRSQDALGEAAIFLFLPGKDMTAIDAHALIETSRASSSNEPSPAAISSHFSFQFVIASPDPQFLQQLDAARQAGNTPSSKKVVLLRDDKNTLRRDFVLQQRFGIAPAQSALLVIDRAGWLRRVEKVNNPAELATLFKTIGDPTPPLTVGQRAPDFALPDMNGTLRRPADLRGKQYLLLTFFPKCFTGTCTKQLESLRDSWPDMQKNDIAVWGVSVDPADGEKGQRAFASFLHLPFPLLPDTGRNLSILYGAAHSPNQSSARMSVLIDKNGILRWIDKQINPTTHGEDVVVKVCGVQPVP